MDIQQMLTTGGISSAGVAMIMIIYKVLKNLNNKKYVSSCCGKRAEVVIAVNELTEQEKKETPKSTPTLKPKHSAVVVPEIDYIV